MDINIKNGIKIASFNDYIIYQIYTDDGNEYYICTPTDKNDKYKMIIDFPEEYYKSLLKNEIIDEIKKVCDILYKTNKNYIYVLTNVTTYELNEAKAENDDHIYRLILRKIQKYTYNIYKSITSNNDLIIDPVINIVTQTKDDRKFIDWLDININGYFNGVALRKDNKFITQNNDDNNGPTKDDGEIVKINTSSNSKVKTLVPKRKYGFSNLAFIVLVLFIAVITGISFSLFILDK